MYRIYFVNHGFYSEQEFKELDEAKEYAKSTGFETVVYWDRDRDGELDMVGSWSTFGGWQEAY